MNSDTLNLPKHRVYDLRDLRRGRCTMALHPAIEFRPSDEDLPTRLEVRNGIGRIGKMALKRAPTQPGIRGQSAECQVRVGSDVRDLKLAEAGHDGYP